MSHTRGHLECKSLGHRSLITPKGSAFWPYLCPFLADLKVTWSEWSWKAFGSLGTGKRQPPAVPKQSTTRTTS